MKTTKYSTVYGWEQPKGIPTLLLCVVALNTVLFNPYGYDYPTT